MFSREELTIRDAEEILAREEFRGNPLVSHYEELLVRYRKLLNDTRRVIRISDMMQKELNCLSERLEDLSNVDQLTDIANRRSFDGLFEKEWLRARRRMEAVSMLMIDIDYFKKFNDLYGHIAGDTCLRAVADGIRSSLKRQEDFVARFGGEEFVVVLPSTDREGAQVLAEAIRSRIEGLGITHGGSSVAPYVTVSIGASTAVPARVAERTRLLAASDEALYVAKKEGRNRVRACVCDADGATPDSDLSP